MIRMIKWKANGVCEGFRANYGQRETSNFACTQHASSLTFTTVTTVEHMCNKSLSARVLWTSFKDERLVSVPDGAMQSPIIILSTVIQLEIKPHTQMTKFSTTKNPQLPHLLLNKDWRYKKFLSLRYPLGRSNMVMKRKFQIPVLGINKLWLPQWQNQKWSSYVIFKIVCCLLEVQDSLSKVMTFTLTPFCPEVT